MRPPYLIHLPCRWVQRRGDDGDTVSVTMLSKFLWRVRLRNIDCPEKHTPEGLAAKHFVEATLEEANNSISVEFQPPENIREIIWSPEPINPLNWPSFNRVVGDLWIGESDRLTDILVNAGHAVRVKG